MTDDDETVQLSMVKPGNSSGRIWCVAKSTLHPKACNLTTFVDTTLSRRGAAMVEQGKVARWLGAIAIEAGRAEEIMA